MSDEELQEELIRQLEKQGWKPQLCDVEVPVYLSTIMCGSPTEMGDEYIEDYRLLPRELVRRIDAYIIKAQGDSMIDMGIEEGDELLIESRETVEDGDTAVVLLDGQLVLKLFFRDEEGVVWLVPQNDDYEPICVGENIELRILGRVRTIFKHNNKRPSFAQMLNKVNRAKEKLRPKGRPRRKQFEDLLEKPFAAQRMQRLRKVLEGRTGRDAAFVMRAAMYLGWLRERPSFASVEDAFGDIGARSGYDKYMNVMLTEDELKELVNTFGL